MPAYKEAQIDDTDVRAFFKSSYHNKSLFQSTYSSDQTEIEIDDYPKLFRERVVQFLSNKVSQNHIDSLENLHSYHDKESKTYDEFHINAIQKSLYDLTEEIRPLYYEFLSKSLYPKLPFDFYFQKDITYRVHTPFSSEYSRFKFPRYHIDSCLGHPPQEINIWIPLTKLHPIENHSFNLCSVKSSETSIKALDYLPEQIDSFISSGGDIKEDCLNTSPVKTPFGKALLFDARCMHSAMPVNYQTRVSIDIRIIPVEEFHKLPYKFRGVGRRKVLYQPGYAYDINKASIL